MKILVYRLSSIGDIVLTTPIVRCLRSTFPNAEIHFLTRKRYIQVLDGNPYIDKVIGVEKSPNEIMSTLRSEKYDLFIDLHRNIRSIKTRFSLGVKYSSFPKLNVKKFLLTKFKINLLPDVHIVSRYFEAVKFLKVKYDGQGLDYFIDSAITLPTEVNVKNNFIVFAIGGTFETKRYPANLLKEVADKLDIPIYIIGGKSEISDGDFIANNTKNVVSLCDKLSLQGSALLISKSELVVTNDTGMMHFAAALKKPIVSIWGNTVPKFGMYPFYPNKMENLNIIIENNNLKCRPCSKLGYKSCPKGHFKCMKEINPSDIAIAVEKLLSIQTLK